MPELLRCSANYKFQVRHCCTDRYSANRKAENGLTEPEFLPKFVRDHAPCFVHGLANCLKHALCPLEMDVAGLLSAGLALSEVGAARKLRGLLADILDERLEIEHSPLANAAEAKRHRQHIYDTFLPTTDAPDATTRRRNQLRRYILERFLNSDLATGRGRGRNPLLHHCQWGCCQSEQQTRQHFRVSPGLISTSLFCNSLLHVFIDIGSWAHRNMLLAETSIMFESMPLCLPGMYAGPWCQ